MQAMKEQFIQDIIHGLSAEKKRIPSKHLYDEKGSLLFQGIMEQPEYYLTKAEWNIFERKADEIVDQFIKGASSELQLMELGAGDGRKTELLLDALDRRKFPCLYEPADIDPTVLNQLVSRLEGKYDYITINPRPGYNDDALQQISKDHSSVLLFLGSNIGNYTKKEEVELIQRIGAAMKPEDKLLLGADKSKDPNLISAAYDDQNKKTAAFNLNLIHRINEAFETDLNPEDFSFYSYYHPIKREVHAFLVNRTEQSIPLPDGKGAIFLPDWTYIQTEISRKYSKADLEKLGSIAGLSLTHHWQDQNQYFFELLFTKK